MTDRNIKPRVTVSRPLALFAAAFAAACFSFTYFAPPQSLYVATAIATAAAIALVAVRRTRAQFVLVLIGFVTGVAYTILFATLIPQIPYTVSKTFAHIINAPSAIANAISAAIERIFPSRLSPFLRALTVGDTKDLTRDRAAYTALSISGLAHIASISGMHVTYLMAMLRFFVRGRRARIFVILPTLVVFMMMTGFSPPICRAVIMAVFVFVAPLFRRRTDSVTSIMTALLLILLFDPTAIRSISLQLSFLSTLGIVLITPRIKKPLDSFAARRKVLQYRVEFLKNPPLLSAVRVLTSSLASTIGALIFSTPLIAYYFGYIAILSPISNILTLWASAAAFIGAIAAAAVSMIFAPLGAIIAAIATLPTDFVLLVARVISKVPFAAIYVDNVYVLSWLAYVYIVFAVYFLLQKSRGRERLRGLIFPTCGTAAMLCVALLLTAFTPRIGLTLTAVDVGQGQSIVVADGSATAVIDCGGNYSAASHTAAFLQTSADEVVELLILTHFHSDHAGGIIELMTRVHVETLVIPESAEPLAEPILAYAAATGTQIVTVREPMSITFGTSQISLYPPYGVDDNEACLTILITNGTWDALITGDMPDKTELLLIENVDLPDIEVLIAGHHGSRYASSEDLLDVVTPELAIISVGANNTYGHPAEDTLARFESRGIRVLRTDLHGTVTVRAAG